jgi:type II secretory pathway pseudopilin PulG
MRLIYVIAALVVLLAFLELADKTLEEKREIEAMGAYKSYLEQARAAGRIGSTPPDPSKVALPEGYAIAVNGSYAELRGLQGVVARDRWR